MRYCVVRLDCHCHRLSHFLLDVAPLDLEPIEDKSMCVSKCLLCPWLDRTAFVFHFV